MEGKQIDWGNKHYTLKCKKPKVTVRNQRSPFSRRVRPQSGICWICHCNCGFGIVGEGKVVPQFSSLWMPVIKTFLSIKNEKFTNQVKQLAHLCVEMQWPEKLVADVTEKDAMPERRRPYQKRKLFYYRRLRVVHVGRKSIWKDAGSATMPATQRRSEPGDATPAVILIRGIWGRKNRRCRWKLNLGWFIVWDMGFTCPIILSTYAEKRYMSPTSTYSRTQTKKKDQTQLFLCTISNYSYFINYSLCPT